MKTLSPERVHVRYQRVKKGHRAHAGETISSREKDVVVPRRD
jgi:hypothetical protein